METGVLSLLAGAIVAKAGLDVWFTSGPFDRVHARRSPAPQAVDARGGFLRGLR
jgi:hypothetical protein